MPQDISASQTQSNRLGFSLADHDAAYEVNEHVLDKAERSDVLAVGIVVGVEPPRQSHTERMFCMSNTSTATTSVRSPTSRSTATSSDVSPGFGASFRKLAPAVPGNMCMGLAGVLSSNARA